MAGRNAHCDTFCLLSMAILQDDPETKFSTVVQADTASESRIPRFPAPDRPRNPPVRDLGKMPTRSSRCPDRQYPQGSKPQCVSHLQHDDLNDEQRSLVGLESPASLGQGPRGDGAWRSAMAR